MKRETTKTNKTQQGNAPLLEQVTKFNHRIQQRLGNKTLPPPEEIIAKMREERTQQLLDSLKD